MVLRLNLDHILVDFVENSSYLFILQFLDGYDDFARKVTGKDDNDHPPVRARQHLQSSLVDQMCKAKCDTNGATDYTVFRVQSFCRYLSSLSLYLPLGALCGSLFAIHKRYFMDNSRIKDHLGQYTVHTLCYIINQP